MKIKIILGFLLIFLVMVSVSKLEKQEEDTIKIGVILPLTGSLANVGAEVKVSIDIALQNSKHDSVEIIYEDDAFDPAKSVDAFNKLVFIDKVDAVIGPLNGSSIEAIRPIAQQTRTVIFTPWGAGNKVSDFVYKNSVETKNESSTIASYIASELKAKKVAIIYLQNEWGISHYNAFKSFAIQQGLDLVSEEAIGLDNTDYRTQLIKTKQANPEVIFVVHTGALGAVVAKQARELGITSQLIGQYGTESSEFIDLGGKNVEGFVYTSFFDENVKNYERDIFIKKFKDSYGASPQIVAYNAYDIYNLLVDTIDSCDSDKTCINEHISVTSDYNGISGNVSFVDGELERNFYFKTISNGKFLPLSK